MTVDTRLSRFRTVFGWATFASLLVVCFQLAVDFGRPIFTDDFWWHLKLGELFLETANFPTSDPFLIRSNPGSPFVHEWLFQLFVAASNRIFGLTGLRLVHVVLGLTTLLVIYRFARMMGCSRSAAIGLLLLFVMVGLQRIIQFRPHLFSILFFYLILQLSCARSASWRQEATALLIMVLWTNVHSISIVIIPFLGVYWLGLVFEGKTDRATLTRRAVFTFTMALSVTLNPRGVELYYFYLTHNANNPLIQIADEWGHLWPPADPAFLPWVSFMAMGAIVVHIALMLLVAARYATSDRGQTGANSFFLLFSGLLAVAISIYAVRFVWMLPLASMAIVKLQRLVIPARFTGLSPAVPVCLGLLALVHVFSGATSGYQYRLVGREPVTRYFLENTDRKFRVPAVDLLSQLEGGNLFNPYFMGGYLAWRLAPEYRTLLDGRFNAYPRSVYEDFLLIRDVVPGFRKRLEKYGFDFFFLPIDDAYYRLAYTLKLLGWRSILHLPDTLILVSPARSRRDDLRAAISAPQATDYAESAFIELVQPELQSIDFMRWSVLLRQALLNQMFRAGKLLLETGENRFPGQVSYEGIKAVCRRHAELEQRFVSEAGSSARSFCEKITSHAMIDQEDV